MIYIPIHNTLCQDIVAIITVQRTITVLCNHTDYGNSVSIIKIIEE